MRDMPMEFVESHKPVTSGNETKTLNNRCAVIYPNKKGCQTTRILQKLQVLDLPAGVLWFRHIGLQRAHGDCSSDLLQGCSSPSCRRVSSKGAEQLVRNHFGSSHFLLERAV